MNTLLTPRTFALAFLIASGTTVAVTASNAENINGGGASIQSRTPVKLKQEHGTENTEYMTLGGLAGGDSYAEETCGCEDLFIGDWVIATSNLDNGPGPGSLGVIISSKDGGLELLVEWESWNDGHAGNYVDACTPYEMEGNSRWWVRCKDVVRDAMMPCACDGMFHIGQRVISNSLQESGPGPGATGTIVGGKELGLSLLVESDNWYDGHAGNGHGSSLCPPALEAGNSRWFVNCASVVPMVTNKPACASDIDGNGIVDGADLQVLLGSWGTCP